MTTLLHLPLAGPAASTYHPDVIANASGSFGRNGAALSSTQVKFSPEYVSSLYLQRTLSQHLLIPDTDLLAFGSGDFTVEVWFYPTSIPGTLNIVGFGPNWDIYLASGVPRLWDGSSVLITGTTTIAANSGWYHMRVCRSAGTVYLFLDGVLEGSAANTANFVGGDPVYLGTYTAENNFFDGYLQDFRVSDTALATTTFSVPGPLAGELSGSSVDGSDTGIARTILAYNRANRSLAWEIESTGGTFSYYGNLDATYFVVALGGTGENAEVFDKIVPVTF